MTTRPLIPFSKSIRDDLMILNKALKRSIWRRREETRFRLDIACEQTPFKGEKKIRWVIRVDKREKKSSEARLDHYVQDYCILMRCILFGSITKRRFHITSQLCVSDLLHMRTLCDTFHEMNAFYKHHKASFPRYFTIMCVLVIFYEWVYLVTLFIKSEQS